MEPLFFERYRLLTIIYIHRYFETKTKIIIAWFFPFHIGFPPQENMIEKSLNIAVKKLIKVYAAIVSKAIILSRIIVNVHTRSHRLQISDSF